MNRILALLLALLLIFCSFGCNEEPPDNTESPNNAAQPPADTGEIISDGNIKYHTGQLIADIYLEGNKIHFTFDNQRSTSVYCSKYDVQVQKWENGEWSFYPFFASLRDSPEAYSTLSAHTRSAPCAMPIYPRAVTPGKYRLISDGSLKGTEMIYWMGEFTITEEQAATYPDLEDLYFGAEGFWQSNNLSLSIPPATEAPYLYRFAVQNNGNRRLVFPVSANKNYHINDVRIEQENGTQRWNEAANRWEYYRWSQPFATEDAFIHPGDSFYIPLCSSDENLPDGPRYVPGDGYYFHFFTCYWEGDTDSIFYAVFYFRVQDGIITQEKPPALSA